MLNAQYTSQLYRFRLSLGLLRTTQQTVYFKIISRVFMVIPFNIDWSRYLC